MQDLEYVRAYIGDLLIISSESYEDHLQKVRAVLTRLRTAGLKVNLKKSFFAKGELEYLGYWITRQGIKTPRQKSGGYQEDSPTKNQKGAPLLYRPIKLLQRHVAKMI